MGTVSTRYSPEVRERAVRVVAEHLHEYSSQWAAIESIAPKIGRVRRDGALRRDHSRVARELQRLRSTQSLAASQPPEHRGAAPHGGSIDAKRGPVRRDPPGPVQ